MAIINGDDLNNVLLGTDLADGINGFGGDDILIGFGGDDFLDGGTGADLMFGGTGNDLYIVDDPGDNILEDLNAGFDVVMSSISFSLLGATRLGIENLTLTGAATVGIGNPSDNAIRGTDADNTLVGLSGDDGLFGQAGKDALFGGAGDDVLDGGLGVDDMRGGNGDDIYYVDNARDVVYEAPGSGIDWVINSISFSLNSAARANIENLNMQGSAFFGIGNALGNIIDGNDIDNSLRGLSGNDSLFGRQGDDALFGGSGNDLLDGGLGADVMTGGGGIGSDRFRFDTALGTIDTIQDFSPAARGNNDAIELGQDVFLGIGPTGILAATAFTKGAAATTISHRIIYDDVTGALYFDPDGIGRSAAVQFATLSGSPDNVTNADFVVIA